MREEPLLAYWGSGHRSNALALSPNAMHGETSANRNDRDGGGLNFCRMRAQETPDNKNRHTNDEDNFGPSFHTGASSF